MLMHTGNTSAEVNCQSLPPGGKPLHLLDNTTANPTLSIYQGTEYQFHLQFHFELQHSFKWNKFSTVDLLQSGTQ